MNRIIKAAAAALLITVTSCGGSDAPILDDSGMDAVDLGLSVKWASCNLGAAAPEEEGVHMAWGETQTKEDFDWENYKWCGGTETSLTKYCTKKKLGTEDNIKTLAAEDDAAAANLGGDWRIPTEKEFKELMKQCNWTWTTVNGVPGYMVRGKKEGYTENSIFLPAAGSKAFSVHYKAGEKGEYASSNLCKANPRHALTLSFTEEDQDIERIRRCVGVSIRPVCK